MAFHQERRLCTPAAILTVCIFAASLLRAGEWKNVKSADGLPINMVQLMKRVGNDVWVGTLDGLVRFRNGKGAKVVAGQAVWDVLAHGKDRYWIGTQNGILLLEGGKTSQSLTGFSVGSLESFGKKGVWAVAERGDRFSLRELRDGVWKAHPRFKGKSVSDLFRTRSGTVWALVETNGIVAADPVKDPSKWVHHLKGINVRSFCEDAQGRIWCGTWGRGIKVLEKGDWTSHLKKEKAAITSIKQDGKGHIWAATNANGLWQYDGAKWKNHLRQEGTINVLEVPANGRVYVSSQSVPVLRVWTGKVWDKVLDVPGALRAVITGPGGKLWAGNTLNGIDLKP